MKTTEIKFIEHIINITTGWSLEGCKDKEEALRLIEKECRDKLRELKAYEI